MEKYFVHKENNTSEIVLLDYNKVKGFNFKPQNNIKYDGIVVNKIVVIKSSMIEKVLKRKIKRKLELYLKLIMNYVCSDDTDGTVLREALNDLTRYKSIIDNKYKKYLDEKYLKILLRKIDLLEYELKSKLIYNMYEEEPEEIKSHRSR